jgi:D-3-phosphoglycerate dehydrogenase / 2-oxoglutarate reductase
VDVDEKDPVLDGDHPLLTMPNALCAPHLGYVERETYETLFGAAIDRQPSFPRWGVFFIIRQPQKGS